MVFTPIRGQEGCLPNCALCNPDNTACFACGEGYETDVFGNCYENVIKDCVIYTPLGQCLGCRPTFKLKSNKCSKDYTGCILFDNFGEKCFECGLGTSQDDEGKCVGIINCLEYSPEKSCSSCMEGYKLINGKCIDSTEGCAVVRLDDGLCQRCKRGFVNSGYICIRESEVLKRCYLQSYEGRCLICKNGYKLY